MHRCATVFGVRVVLGLSRARSEPREGVSFSVVRLPGGFHRAWRAVGQVGLIGWLGVGLHAESGTLTAFWSDAGQLVVCRPGEELLRVGTAVWGPGWRWADGSWQSQVVTGSAVAVFRTHLDKAAVELHAQVVRTAPDVLELASELKTDRDVALTLFVIELAPGKTFAGRSVMVESGTNRTAVPCPFGRRTLGQQVQALRLTDAAGRQTGVRLEPACEVTADGPARIVLAKDRLPADSPRRGHLRLQLPEPTDWFPSQSGLPDEPGLESWYVWQPTGELSNSVLSLAAWLDKPAGKHGRIQRQADQLIYNQRPIKLWGLNLCYSACAPEKALAERRASFYPHYGINAVRLHKFADGRGWQGIQANSSAAEYDPAGLDRMDYQVAQFKAAGIYVVLSAHFGTIRLGPADRRAVPFLDEFGALLGPEDRVTAPHSAFFYSPQLQDLHIRQIVNLLKHRNPYTGLTYAEDPVVCALEIINEQSALFYTSMEPLKRSPTLRRQAAEQFSNWLRRKYGSHDALLKAWGQRALDSFTADGFPAGEHLDRNNILPLGNPWYWDPQQLAGSQAFRKQRLLDTLQFLYELQCQAYDRYVAAVRQAGYPGEIIGSNWQAGRAYSHYANLHSDARVGLIDRHNYFGGGGGRGAKGQFNPASMLARAGSGLLSTGLQQVHDRPFMLSEWIHVFPNEWGVEGPAIVAAYGLGLQGWDASFMFQNNDQAAFSRQLGGSQWDVMAPQILGVFPAVARQVWRGDVRQADQAVVRPVHVPSLFEGRLAFEDRLVQGYDDKELDSNVVPARALAVARCTVQFTDRWQEATRFDLKPYQQDGWLVASTGQLRWREAPDSLAGGYFTIDTPGTKAVIGFAQGHACHLGQVRITPQSRFAAIYVTALAREATVDSDTELLVVALGRARNTGMKFSPTGDQLLDKGKAPIRLEPVKATIALQTRRVLAVHRLDHDGRRTGQTLPATNNSFTIDGARDQTPYYLISCQD